MQDWLKPWMGLLEPLGLVWLLWGLWLLRQRPVWQRRTHGFMLMLWLFFSAFACTPLTGILLLSLEEANPPQLLEKLQPADVVVCLGGSAGPSRFEVTGVNFSSNVDRIISGLHILAQGKAKAMLIGGGAYLHQGRWVSEADAVARIFSGALSLPKPLTSLGYCADTHDEAVKTARIAAQKGWRRIILVTSAAHMKRAQGCFEKLGLQVEPVRCDFISCFLNPQANGRVLPIHPPRLGALQGMGSLIHEWLGLLLYRWRGWI
jgi:uncharacterized SAM-binding protein YcdF (DUF218 family)